LDIKTIFHQINNYHKELGYGDSRYSEMSMEQKMQHFRDHSFALFQEVAELSDSMPWKPWRSIDSQSTDIANVRVEIVDCLFFLGSLMEICGITPEDVEFEFTEKLLENYKRIKTGYNNRPKDRK